MINREMDLVQHSLRNLSPLGAQVDLKIVIIGASPNFWIIFYVHDRLFHQHFSDAFKSQVKENMFCFSFIFRPQ